MYSKIAVVIPSRNINNLTHCVASVLLCEPNIDVLVVDDGLEHWPQTFHLNGIRRVEGVKPFIYARNCNEGMMAAQIDQDIILLNDDALLETHKGFSKMRQEWLDNQEYGIIGASMDKSGQPEQLRRGLAGLRPVKWMLVFACVFIPRLTIERIGFLDERFSVNAGGKGPRGYGCEDDDYSWRVRSAGLKLGVSDSCFVNHSTLPSTFRDDPEHKADVSLHEAVFMRKWGVHPHDWKRPYVERPQPKEVIWPVR